MAANGKVKNDKQLLRDFRDVVFNASRSLRETFAEMFLDKRRDVEGELGYPATEQLDAQKYKDLYDRDPLSARVVDLMPLESWKKNPILFEDEELDNETEFETVWNEIGKQLRGPGFFESSEDQGHPIWDYLQRLDRLSGVGHYGCLLLGIGDGQELDQPIEFRREGDTGVEHDLLFVRPLDETVAEIANFEQDENSPRFGLPIDYNVTIESPGLRNKVKGSGLSERDVRVHWSRIVHVVDNRDSSEVFGRPRMQTVYNRLYDLYKLYGGSAEMYWLAAFMGISFETQPGIDPNVDIDIDNMRSQVENYMHTLQRYMAIPGLTAKTLAPSVVDPASHIDAQIQALCIYLDCPQRIFMGSERGELASSQDAKRWVNVVRERQEGHVTANVIVPVIDRLIQVGVLPVPEQYGIRWPDVETLNELERAEIAAKHTEALVKYIGGNVEALVQPIDYFVRFLGKDEEEATSMIDNTLEAMQSPDEGLDLTPPQMMGGPEDADQEDREEVPQGRQSST